MAAKDFSLTVKTQ